MNVRAVTVVSPWLVTAAHVSHSHAGQMHYWQAIILGVLQGVSELFPVSSLGHTVIFPALFGWHNVVAAQSASESFWLAFLVGLHVGTAIGLVVYFRKDWVKIVGALVGSARRRTITTPTERLGWLLVVATIPAGITGIALEHPLRVLFSKPIPASAFLVVNGFLLATGELLRRRRTVQVSAPVAAGVEPSPRRPDRALATLNMKEGFVVGVAQVCALVAGISRSGITMVAGLARGLNHEDAARFSFLLATPIILAAGVYKLPDLLGTTGAGVRGQTLAAAACAGVAAWISVRFLTRWFTTRTLTPFAVYCVVFGSAMLIHFN
jgi:undecaprenyl-diphosphatase